jgi:hypothetical protein
MVLNSFDFYQFKLEHTSRSLDIHIYLPIRYASFRQSISNSLYKPRILLGFFSVDRSGFHVRESEVA